MTSQGPDAKGSKPAPRKPWRLAVFVEGRRVYSWLEAFEFESHGIEPVLFHAQDAPPPSQGAVRYAGVLSISPGRSQGGFPDFEQILEGLEQEEVQACLILDDDALSHLAVTAAELVGVPIFLLLTSEHQLTRSGPRGQRPDLFFLADGRLFGSALEDGRYGSTLLPTGHPGRDVYLRDPSSGDSRFDTESLGDGQAGARILSAADRWLQGELDTVAPELSVVVPAYNEAENLPMVCEQLLSALEDGSISFEILLVDDVSRDDTRRVAESQMWRSARIRAFSKPLPRGMGNAIRYGLQKARAPIIAVTMADGSDEVSRIPEMFSKIHEEGARLAIGSRYRYRKNYQAIPKLYRFWSFCFRLTTWLLIGLKLSDYTNAFRVYHRDIFGRYGPESPGFEISPETTFKAWFATRRVIEVDVRHLKRASGQSSFSFLRAGPGYAKVLLKAFINRLTGKWFTLEW